jgi:hypothetical protein
MAVRARFKLYLEWLHSLPCVVCERLGLTQKSRTEAAHTGVRGLRQKASDLEAIPLCGVEHHRLGRHSHHVLGKRFFEYHGIDRDALVRSLQQQFYSEAA